MDSRKDKPGEHDKDGFFQNHKRECSPRMPPRTALISARRETFSSAV